MLWPEVLPKANMARPTSPRVKSFDYTWLPILWATPLYVDNTTAVGLANDNLKIKCFKSIDMRFHWLRDRAQEGQIRVIHITCTKLLADFFTKALHIWHHLTLLTKFVRLFSHCLGIKGCVFTINVIQINN